MEQLPSLIEWSMQREREENESKDLLGPSPERSLLITDDFIDWVDDSRPMEYYHRSDRAVDARGFTVDYKFVQGEKTCITSKGRCVCQSDKCFDSTWVAVHGMELICMVTRRQDVDMTRVHPFYQRCFTNEQTMCTIAEAIISEVECIPYDDGNYNDDDLRLRYGRVTEKPFGVVSVVLDTKKVHEESGHEDSSYEYDVSKATMFLEEKMKSGLAFTIDETIQTAVSAFQHMCLQELKAEDIWVSTLTFLSGNVDHLPLNARQEFLAVINGGGSASSAVDPTMPLFFRWHSPLRESDDDQPSLAMWKDLESQFSSLSIY